VKPAHSPGASICCAPPRPDHPNLGYIRNILARVQPSLRDSRRWHGDGHALDVGCGGGLVPIGIARRLGRQGRAHGLDLWQAGDPSGNTPQCALASAVAVSVADRVVIDAGDMRVFP
jgi:hypothetical protein